MSSTKESQLKGPSDEGNKRIIQGESNNKTCGRHLLEIGQLVLEVLLLVFKIQWYFLEALCRLVMPVQEKSVKGEIVLITGTGNGIGRELALQYASQGATVVCWDIDRKSNEETVKIIAELNYPKAHAYVCNVANREDVMGTANRVQKEVGHVTVLINNAGIACCRPFLDHTVDEIERLMNVNVMGHFWTLHAFLPAMLNSNHGHIVAISSVAGYSANRYLVPYSTTKFAVRGMMEVLLHELSVNPDCKIKLTVIYPTMVDTQMCKNLKNRFPCITPLQKPEDVAKGIMKAQRQGVAERSIPSMHYKINCFIRLLPFKVGAAIVTFLDSYLEPDS